MKTARCTQSSKMGASTTWLHRTYLWVLVQTDISHHRKRIHFFDYYQGLIMQHMRRQHTWHPPAGLEDENRSSPDEVSVKTASVWPPTVCMVNGCSRGAHTDLSSIPSITVSSSFKVKDTWKEKCHPTFNNLLFLILLSLSCVQYCSITGHALALFYILFSSKHIWTVMKIIKMNWTDFSSFVWESDFRLQI